MKLNTLPFALSALLAINAGMPKLADAEGKETMKHLDALTASAVESIQENLFQFAPSISFLPDAWATADTFWKRKAPAPKPTPAPKPPQ